MKLPSVQISTDIDSEFVLNLSVKWNIVGIVVAVNVKGWKSVHFTILKEGSLELESLAEHTREICVCYISHWNSLLIKFRVIFAPRSSGIV